MHKCMSFFFSFFFTKSLIYCFILFIVLLLSEREITGKALDSAL